MIEAGTADFTYGVPPDNLAALDARDEIVVYTNPSFQNLVGLLNTQKPTACCVAWAFYHLSWSVLPPQPWIVISIIYHPG